MHLMESDMCSFVSVCWMKVEHVVATLSVLVFEEKCDEVLPKDPVLLQGFERIQVTGRTAG